MNGKNMKVWDCKIVVYNNDILSIEAGLDAVPRQAAIKAIEAAGYEVAHCFSGWGGTLTEVEKEVIAEFEARSNHGT